MVLSGQFCALECGSTWAELLIYDETKCRKQHQLFQKQRKWINKWINK